MKMQVSEKYSGTSLVGWHGKIERHLVELRDKYDGQHNRQYRDKIDEFLRLWRSYPITGSVNIEEIAPLEAAASTLAVDSWQLTSYFTAVRDKLRAIIASEQELPDVGTDFKPSRSFVPSRPGPPSTYGAETNPGDAEKFGPDEKFRKKNAEKSAEGEESAPVEAPAEPGFKESLDIQSARRLISSKSPMSVFAVQESNLLRHAVSRGWLRYSYDTGYYHISNLNEAMATADNYDVGDQVITSHNGKPVVGTVSKRNPDGTYQLSFDSKLPTQDKPEPTKAFSKDQLRKNDNKAPGTIKQPGTGTTAAAHNLYGI